MKFFYKNELKKLWPFYLNSLLAPLLFFAPAFIIVFLNDLNLSYLQIGILLAISPLFSLIFEIPTGAIADLYGRKFSVLLGLLIEAFTLLSLFFVREYYLLLILFSLWGFGATLSSGSDEAWVVDLVKKNKNFVKSFFHKSQSFGAFSLIFSGIIGAFLVQQFGIPSIWIFAFISYILSILILLFAEENYVRKKIKIKASIKELFKQTKKTISYGFRHHVLYYYLIATFLFSAVTLFSMGPTWTPLLLELNFPRPYFGYMWSAISFISMIAPIISSKLLKEGKEKIFIMVSLAISGIIALFILLPQSWFFALLVLLSIQFFFVLRMPASYIYFHKFTPSKLRSTMGSVKSMLSSLAVIIFLPVVGYLIDIIGARYAIFLYAPLTIPVIWIYSKIKEKEMKK